MNTQPEPARAATLDALTPQQIDALLNVVNAILETAPQERPERWDEIPDKDYNAYMAGQRYLVWSVGQQLRKALAPRPGDGDPAGGG